MSDIYIIEPIAHIVSPFPSKFGVPRQSGIAESIISKIIFEPQYRDAQAFRGLEEYSHLWLIWQFSRSLREGWSPTVRPPKLGGNTRVGVFATRSPFRPNPLGLSCVKIEKIVLSSPDGPVIYVSGADLVDGTPIYDIKPYIAYTDSHPDALCGFALDPNKNTLEVIFPQELAAKIPSDLLCGLVEILKQDPRPAYQNDESRIYLMEFADFDVGFKVADGVLTVIDVKEKSK